MNSDSKQGSDFLMKEEIKLGTKSTWEKHTKKQRQQMMRISKVRK